MAMAEALVVTRLNGFAGLTSLISTRLYPGVAKDKETVPYVGYTRVSGGREASHSGSSDLAQSRIRFTVWDTDYRRAKQVAQQIVLALNGYRFGESGIQGGSIENERDDFDEDTLFYSVQLDYLFWHRETIT